MCIFLPKGTFLISTGLIFDTTACMIGSGSSYGEDTNSSTILSSGGNAAITVGQDSSTERVYNAYLSNFRIKASGTATTSATASD